MEQAIGMMDALHLAEATHAGVERRHLWRPLPGIGADLDDAAVADVGIDHAAAAAVVATRAGDDGLAGLCGHPRRLVDGAGADPGSHGGDYDSIDPAADRAAVALRASCGDRASPAARCLRD